uniref:Uncharacterized protein n=1 Tax=Lates calcarifer TaxID=8187 RepID=A0A4W6FAY0_LATCA
MTKREKSHQRCRRQTHDVFLSVFTAVYLPPLLSRMSNRSSIFLSSGFLCK